MHENIILTTPEYENEASSFVQQYGGLVMTSCAVFVEQNGNFSETPSSLTWNEAYGLKVVDGYEKHESYEENYSTTPSYAAIEQTLSQAGIMVNPRVYVISSDSVFSNEYEMLYRSAEILNKISGLNVWIIKEDGQLKFFPKL